MEYDFEDKPRRKGTFKRRVIMVATIALAVMLALTIKQGMRVSEVRAAQDKQLEPFKPFIAQWMNTAGLRQTYDDPYIRGKVVMIDTRRKEVDRWMQFELPDALRAHTPQEVGTVVLVTAEQVHVGYYVDEKTGERTGEAHRGDVHLTVIDVKDGKLVKTLTIRGKDPAGQLENRRSDSTTPRRTAVPDYLKSLPQK